MLLVLVGAPRAQDDDAVPTHAVDVDTSAYTRALYLRFTGCLAEEGTALAGGDEATIRETLDTLSPMLSFLDDGRCTASASAVQACTATVEAMTCAGLQDEISGALSGITGNVPDWATRYGDALVGRIGTCYAAETGVALTAAEAEDLETYSGWMAQAIAGVAQACPVDEARAQVCIDAVAAMSCAHLGDVIAQDEQGEDAEMLVEEFVQGCTGFLDCE